MGVGQRRDEEVKDWLSEGCRDKLLGEGCKYKLPVSRERVTRQVKTLLIKYKIMHYNWVQFDLSRDGTLPRGLKYWVFKQSGCVCGPVTHICWAQPDN